MLRVRTAVCLAAVASVGLFWSVKSSEGAETPAPPPAPKVSTFAPAEDLVRQADQYIHGLEEIVATPQQYKDDQDKIAKNANTLVIMALALGLHDQPNKYHAHAGALMKAAQELAATKDFGSAKKAFAGVQAAAKGETSTDQELHWQKVASLPELMKQVPIINTNLKRYLKPEKFKSKAKEAAGCTAVIAAIAQGTMADTSEAKNTEQVKQWYEFSTAMRKAAGTLNGAIHKGDRPGADKAMKKLAQSCEDCHAVFHPGVIANQGGK
jgi:hypothetical protein